MPWSVTLLGGVNASAPAICGNVPDSLYLFTITRQHHLMLRRFTGRWSRWSVVSTEVLGEGAPAGIVVGRGTAEAAHVFARGANDHVLHMIYANGRGAWVDLEGETRLSPAVCAPAPADLMLFVTAPGGALRTRRFHDGSWQPWQPLDGPPGGADVGPAVSADRETGQIDLAVRSSTGLWFRRRHPERGWGGWHQVPGQELGQVAAITRGERVDLFARDAGARLSHNWLDRDWHGWERVNDVVLSSHPSALSVGGVPYVAALGRHDQARLYQAITRAPAGRTTLFFDIGDTGDETEVADDLENDDDPTSLVSSGGGLESGSGSGSGGTGGDGDGGSGGTGGDGGGGGGGSGGGGGGE